MGIFVLKFAEIPMMQNISWVVQECRVKFGPKCSGFHEMAAISNRKKYIVALISTLVIPTILVRNIARGTLFANFIANDLDL